ncbi:hypothetical protein Cfla_0972 [Cellulomonas flavigena DSM 20109]|uniref:Uncharacterized protein n=1 Tax=Cellulomonas flavigena (strain ATCC 482 / DSM 20109 / BCRC 11376 / JCM 18109 / NBRC 3775 / NCIMB 8073 / NRS 134) TaxID=446466 RepID=D5UKR0_CELFN|nr:hypothetical protein [Cellulomonas flavigena]ADG73878.1 hypothetical protein Cfla_0972 [Cellulomonas flavigena DSM 20109]
MTTPRWDRLVATSRPNLSVVEGLHGRPSALVRPARQRWEEEARNAPLVRVSVVQADRSLDDPTDRRPRDAVVLYTTDPRLCRDTAWLAEVTQRVRAVRGGRSGDPALARLRDLLDGGRDGVVEDVPKRLTGGVRTRIQATRIGPGELPGPTVPEDGMLLGLALETGVRLLRTAQYE